MSSEDKLNKLDIAVWAGLALFATSAIIIGICLPEISRTFATDLSEGGGLETARNVLVLAVLLLAGLLAQRWGKKRFLTLGQYLIAAGLLLGSLSANYAVFLLALTVVGVGGGFSEALINPLVVDNHRRESGKFLNLASAFYSIGVVGSALIFGQMLTLGYSWRLIFQIAAAGALVVAVYFTVLRFPPAEIDRSASPRQFKGILTLGGFWLYASALFLGGSVESGLTFWSRSYVDAYLSDLPRSGAVAVVVFAGSMAFGRVATAFLANRVDLNTIVMGSAILGVVVSGLIPFATTLSVFYALLALAGLATASLWPSILALADANLRVNTTLLFVCLASVGIAGYGFTPWLMGVVGDYTELKTAFIVIPLLFLMLMGILVVERHLTARRLRMAVEAGRAKPIPITRESEV